MSDWPIAKLIKVVVAIQLAMVGLVGLSLLGYDIPVLRQVIGFIYLAFIPGVLILRILKIHNIGVLKTTLYSVGLSIAFLMFAGFLMNSFFPHVGISKPISILPLTATLLSFTTILCIVACIRDKNFQPPKVTKAEVGKACLIPLLFLSLLLVLAILGSVLVDFRQSNALLLVLLPIVACIPILVIVNKFIPVKVYSWAIVAITLAIFSQQTLISPFLTGGSDIHAEYYFQGLVVTNSYWDASIPHNYNAVLSIIMLPPIYSLLLDIDSVWVFKIIYPLAFLLVPLGLFEIYRRQIGARKAFLSIFFFMSILFIVPIAALARQQIAQIFLVLLILLILDEEVSRSQKSALAVIFAISLVVSHYALAYIAMAFFSLGWLLLLLFKKERILSWWERLCNKLGSSPTSQTLTNSGTSPSMLTGSLISLYLVFLLAWYMYISSGSAFNTIVNIGNHLYSQLGEFVSFRGREAIVGAALGLDWGDVSLLGRSFRVLQILTQLFIIVGFIKLILKPGQFKFRLEYVAFMIVAGSILLASIVVPYFAAAVNMARVYGIALIFLSPLCILGGSAFWGWIVRAWRSIPGKLKARRAMSDRGSELAFGRTEPALSLLVLVILVPYFLLCSGWVFEVTKHEHMPGDAPWSIALSNYRVDGFYHTRQDDSAAKWLTGVIGDNVVVYGDHFGRLLLAQRIYFQVRRIPPSGEVLDKAHLLLRSWNIEREEVAVLQWRTVEHKKLSDGSTLSESIKHRGVVYDNGRARILAPRYTYIALSVVSTP